MQTKSQGNPFLAEAIRIGDQLLSAAERTPHGCYWETMTMYEGQIQWRKGEDLYGGVSGIAYFLLTLYQQTAEPRYLEACKEGMRWVANSIQTTPAPSHAWYTGRLGTAFAFQKLWEQTGEAPYLEQAISIALETESALENPVLINDLINGNAGIMIGLLQLYHVSGHEGLKALLFRFAQRLIEGVEMSAGGGVYWDRSFQHIKGLCGFSHGAAGIAWALTELGIAFQEENLISLGRMAWYYEDQQYNPRIQNWPDFRLGLYTQTDWERHQERFEQADLAYYTEGLEMNAWCHGAMGIGLARKRMWNLIGRKEDEVAFQIALRKNEELELISGQIDRNYTLCHGSGGNADLFIEGWLQEKNPKWKAAAEQVGHWTLENHRQKGYYTAGYPRSGTDEDLSLFMGIAGIGYFMLRLYRPDQVPSILLPVPPPVPNPKEAGLANIGELAKEKILTYRYRKSATVFQSYLPDAWRRQLRLPINPNETATQSWPLPAHPRLDAERFKDLQLFEAARNETLYSVKSEALLYYKEHLLAAKAAELLALPEEELMQQALFKDPVAQVHESQWVWGEPILESWERNLHMEAGHHVNLFRVRAYPTGMQELQVSVFAAKVIEAFTEVKTPELAFQEILTLFDHPEGEGLERVKAGFVQQVQQALQMGILLDGSWSWMN